MYRIIISSYYTLIHGKTDPEYGTDCPPLPFPAGNLPLCAADKIIDELLRRAPGRSAAPKLPLIGFQRQFLLGEGDLGICLSDLSDYMQVLLVRRFEVADRDAEARHEGQFLLHGIAAVHLVIVSLIRCLLLDVA